MPVSWSALHRQRLRWNRSLIRNRWRKFRNVFNPLRENFTWRDVIASANALWFNFILSVSYLIYLAYIFSTFGTAAWAFFVAIHVLMFIADLVTFVIGWQLVGRPDTGRLLIYLPGWTIFQGLIMRVNRIQAYFSELLFRRSYQDSFYPSKVRQQQEQF